MQTDQSISKGNAIEFFRDIRCIQRCTFLLLLFFVHHSAFSKNNFGPFVQDSVTYEVKFKTGNVIGGGTDANIYCRLTGRSGQSNEIMLKTKGVNNFEVGALDVFNITAPKELIDIQYIIIRMENARPNEDDWFIEDCRVKNLTTGSEWDFECYSWIYTKSPTALLENARKPDRPGYYFYEVRTFEEVKYDLRTKYSLGNGFSKDDPKGLREGSVVEYQTDNGLYGKMVITGYYVKDFTIEWITYANSGKIFSQGKLGVGENDFVDLDKGERVSSTGDFQFIIYPKARWLVSKKGTNFRLMNTTFDEDKDGINDNLEGMLLKMFSPLYLFDGGENFRPTDVEWYFNRSELLPSGDEDDPPIFTKEQLSSYPGVLLTANISNPDRYCSADSKNKAHCKSDLWDNQRATLYHINVYNDYRRGNEWSEVTTNRNTGLYGHVTCANKNYQRGGSSVSAGSCPLYKVEYWQFYAYNWNDRPLSIGDHEADWEAVQLLIDPITLDIVSVFHYTHGNEIRFDMNCNKTAKIMSDRYFLEMRSPNFNENTEIKSNEGNNQFLQLFRDSTTRKFTHPVAYIEEGTHAFWPSPYWKTCEYWHGIEVGCTWSHAGTGVRYLTDARKRNLGEVDFPLHQVPQADIILRYNGVWGAYSNQNDPPCGPILHTEWSWPANSDVKPNIPKNNFSN